MGDHCFIKLSVNVDRLWYEIFDLDHVSGKCHRQKKTPWVKTKCAIT